MSLYPVQNDLVLYRVILFIYGGILFVWEVDVCGGDLFSFCFSHAGRERCVCRRIRNAWKIRGKSWDFPRILWGKTVQNVGLGCFTGGMCV